MTQAGESKLRLMVVDDESDNLDLLYRTFRREFDVFKAESALIALRLLDQEGEMAVIISDQRMPKMSGTEFLSRTVERFPDTIRIVLTGYTDVEDLVGAINTGKVFKYITKPWNPDELKRVVQQAADTYRVVKQRTTELQRALRRESLFNAVTTAIRESLDYRSMLQTVVNTIGRTFTADACILRPVESVGDPIHHRLLDEVFSYRTEASAAELSQNDANQLGAIAAVALKEAIATRQIQSIPAEHQTSPYNQLIVPLSYQQDFLAILVLYRGGDRLWSVEEIELIEGVSQQASLAISQAKLYQQIQEQTEQMRTELAVARQIQSNLLRQTLPEVEGVKVQACCYPAREVGGDFFEVYQHPQGDLWLAVGDVSGKGVPAALFMASAISVLRRELSQENPPAPNIVMRHLNSSLSEDLVGSNCFITMVLARYTPSTQQLVYANAGHIYPLIWSPQQVLALANKPDVTVEPTYLEVRGVPLGILPVWQAAAEELTLKSGQILLLASDGITEATVSDETIGTSQQSTRSMLKQSGLWRLLIQQQGELSLTHLLTKIRAHHKVQEDDQTILSLEVL
ncbi:SpoIIE family protein phosphatase [Leptolyngbya sp. FACHB-671]|uniref:SpoIIE family protein phosphatase n=1 Tax=Leptolyngbya sp. FACHB-671 TaxID=2692812 RepID=UPI0016875E55|nr:SpoIIE family protein phosphatase [Leptolyngbya sp. FACHB-671]MBD2069779.1 SpoIIE family protein phosphatase [Leptolyngbya sp. FACHB-671]